MTENFNKIGALIPKLKNLKIVYKQLYTQVNIKLQNIAKCLQKVTQISENPSSEENSKIAQINKILKNSGIFKPSEDILLAFMSMSNTAKQIKHEIDNILAEMGSVESKYRLSKSKLIYYSVNHLHKVDMIMDQLKFNGDPALNSINYLDL